MKIRRVHMVTNLFRILNGLLNDSVKLQTVYPPEVLHRFFVYSLCWSLGALLGAPDRHKFSAFLMEISENDNMPPLSASETIYDYYVDAHTLKWV